MNKVGIQTEDTDKNLKRPIRLENQFQCVQAWISDDRSVTVVARVWNRQLSYKGLISHIS